MDKQGLIGLNRLHKDTYLSYSDRNMGSHLNQGIIRAWPHAHMPSTIPRHHRPTMLVWGYEDTVS